ncbi:energy-coupling factor transporter transmembrane component T [Companilactobacillus huachuanensis]|uniref:Energy-coupling factor transporter transmembrane component T n=1 Tax=Companilactobacillus huachuanensis TaxID=2559914 RepID=A0ABW1RN82_9LACO|nr:energy-coupling factor transporter transmembrane component T [Companilactobacillus huachuanensis]
MNKWIKNFQKNCNSITMFVYLLNVILITLLYNNPIILVGILISLIAMVVLTRPEKVKSYLKFSGIIFLITILFNLILNQRGTNLLFEMPFVRVTTESLLNAVVLGISFVNLLWAFYLYDSLIRIKTIFELLANLFKSIAIIFILTVKFIPQIIRIYTETKAISKFRVNYQSNEQGLLKRIKQAASLNEIVLNKAVAKFMNISDTLILKGYEQRHRKLGHLEYKKSDVIILILGLVSVIFNISISALHLGKIRFGSANLKVSTHGVALIIIFNCLFILLPLLTGGMNYLWWKFYNSRTTASDTITVKNYR